jgi:hypothetical protein
MMVGMAGVSIREFNPAVRRRVRGSWGLRRQVYRMSPKSCGFAWQFQHARRVRSMVSSDGTALLRWYINGETLGLAGPRNGGTNCLAIEGGS